MLKYRPLKTEHNEIRVLELFPASDSSAPLEGILRHVKRDAADFEALSYVWGQQEKDTSTIRIHYRAKNSLRSKVFTVEIGSNLSRALRCLREIKRIVVLWTDRLCINQHPAPNDKEKGRQVAMMKHIYARARKVHAWLGPSIQDDESVSKLVSASIFLCGIVWKHAQTIPPDQRPRSEQDWLHACFALANIASTKREETSWDEYVRALRASAESDLTVIHDLESLKALSKMDYFSRIWILQETGRADSLVFHYGNEEAQHLHVFLALCLAHSFRTSPSDSQIQTDWTGFDPRFLACLTARTTCSENRSVQDVLEAAFLSPRPTNKATDPRDLIYARLGLASDMAWDLNIIREDYDEKATKLYTATSELLLKKGFTQPLISFKPYQFQKGPPTNLPTALAWLSKDWYLPSWAYAWHIDGLRNFERYYAAADTTAQIDFVPCNFAEFGKALRISGVRVGYIQSRGERFSTLATNAGMGPEEIEKSSIRTGYKQYSDAEKEKISSDIFAAHRKLKVAVSEEDVRGLFYEREARLAGFWRWWLSWVEELGRMNANLALHHKGELDERRSAELILREAPARLDPARVAEFFGTLGDRAALLNLRGWLDLFSATEARDRAFGMDLVETFFRSAWGMRLAVLDTGRICNVPEETNEGDEVVIFYGVQAPLVLRSKRDETGIQSIVGPAHVPGIMDGELMEKDLPSESYTLL